VPGSNGEIRDSAIGSAWSKTLSQEGEYDKVKVGGKMMKGNKRGLYLLQGHFSVSKKPLPGWKWDVTRKLVSRGGK